MFNGIHAQITTIAMVMATALPAAAGDFGFSFHYSKHKRHHGVDVGVVIGRPQVVVPAPAPVVVTPPVVVPPQVVVPVVPVRRVYVPPVYRIVTERVWVPTTKTVYRDVPVFDVYGNIVSYRREPCTVPSGYWQVVQKRVIAREGYWTTTNDAAAPVEVAPAQPGLNEVQPDQEYGNVGYGSEPAAPRGYSPGPGAIRASAIQPPNSSY